MLGTETSPGGPRFNRWQALVVTTVVAVPVALVMLVCGGGGSRRDATPSVTTATPASGLAPGVAVRARAGYPACSSAASYEMLARYVSANDRDGAARYLDAPSSGCRVLTSEDRGVVQTVSVTSLSFRVAGGTTEMWTVREAVNRE